MFAIRCRIFQTPTPDEVEILDDVIVEVDGDVVSRVVAASEYSETVHVELPSDQVLVPGFVDLHIHAPQWPQLGTGYDVPLDEWLFEHTFPTEAQFADTEYARQIWADMVPSLLSQGTTTAVYYGSIHLDATTALAQACITHGQRAWVGRTAMDHPTGTPDYYRDESPESALAASSASIEAIEALDDPLGLVRPIITPRFIPACTDELLSSLGELASETGHLVQTHCSENDWEHGYVLDRHQMSDTESLDRFGLLREHTVLAHGCLLGDSDMDLIATAGAGVAHCPLSNIYFGDAVFPLRRAMERNVRVGLGTDIAGGPSPSLIGQAARAIDVSRHLENGVDQRLDPAARGVDHSRITATTAFHLATLGGAEVLGAPVGLIEPGRKFDAVAVSLDRIDNVPGGDRPMHQFEKLVRLGGASDIAAVWVGGEQVSGERSWASKAGVGN